MSIWERCQWEKYSIWPESVCYFILIWRLLILSSIWRARKNRSARVGVRMNEWKQWYPIITTTYAEVQYKGWAERRWNGGFRSPTKPAWHARNREKVNSFTPNKVNVVWDSDKHDTREATTKNEQNTYICDWAVNLFGNWELHTTTLWYAHSAPDPDLSDTDCFSDVEWERMRNGLKCTALMYNCSASLLVTCMPLCVFMSMYALHTHFEQSITYSIHSLVRSQTHMNLYIHYIKAETKRNKFERAKMGISIETIWYVSMCAFVLYGNFRLCLVKSVEYNIWRRRVSANDANRNADATTHTDTRAAQQLYFMQLDSISAILRYMYSYFILYSTGSTRDRRRGWGYGGASSEWERLRRGKIACLLDVGGVEEVRNAAF